ncbi:MAG: DUF4381 family protein [Gammaproteobacteria bacterium]|jgi:hypothetical protein|nr:DUF4381 family protein [Gammaproteobacteria bacterium]
MSPAELPLRDIHLPEPVGWWPPAPGWWVLAALMLAGAAAWAWLSWRRRTRVRRAALAELRRIERDYAAEGDVARLAKDLSTLMRRAAITAEERHRVAGLTGEEWLAWLDRGLDGRPFSEGPGRCLAEAPYRPDAEEQVVDAMALLGLCRARLRNLEAAA